MAKRAKRSKPARRTAQKAARKTARTPAKRARKAAGKAPAARRSGKRQSPRLARPAKATKAKKAKKKAPRTTAARLNRPRRTLDDLVPTPPSSLHMNAHGSAATTGRAELEESLHEHTGMTPTLTGGDVDADWEQAYFSGDEAPGGDNPTPDQDIVEDIGRSLGVEYQDNEELRSSDKVTKRDKHRWELDPASSEDYKERK
jgi:hypothetical protein